MSFPASKSNLKQLRKTRSQKNLKGFRPQLTSLVDVMTILLIYLLKSFSAEGEIMTVSKELVLPESSAEKKPELTVVIMVNNNYILAENKHIASVDEVLTSKELIIPQLDQWLAQRREMSEHIEKYSTKTKFSGDVTIQGDKRIRFRLLKKIMYTCGQQGYNNFSLAVQRREG
ncbi:MAG: ExbD/TolR family protein [Chitinispirillaceae bacterium]